MSRDQDIIDRLDEIIDLLIDIAYTPEQQLQRKTEKLSEEYKASIERMKRDGRDVTS